MRFRKTDSLYVPDHGMYVREHGARGILMGQRAAQSAARRGFSGVIPASQVATQLVITTQPSGFVDSVNATTQPVLEARDVSNTKVSGYSGTCAVAKATGTGTLTGTSVTFVNGVATFTDVKIAGTGSHSLIFSSGSLASATSSAFTVGAAGGGGGTWTNEPVGYSLINDEVFNIAIPTAQFGNVDAHGWAEAYNTGGLGTIITDSGAPLDSGAVFQEKYPAGFAPDGGAPCTYYYDMAGKSKLYTGFYWKPSSPWQGHTSSINKVVFIKFGTNNSGLTMYGPNGGPYQLRYFPEFLASWTYQPAPTTIVLGNWYLIETVTDTVAGTFSWWVNGVQQGPWTGLTFPAGGVTEFSISPTWGGRGGTVSADQYFWYNHVHLSGVT